MVEHNMVLEQSSQVFFTPATEKEPGYRGRKFLESVVGGNKERCSSVSRRLVDLVEQAGLHQPKFEAAESRRQEV